MSRHSTIGTTLAALVVSACQGGTSTTEASGECGSAWGGEVCTWSVTEGGAVVQVGATIPVASLAAAPPDAPFLWPPATEAALDIPEGAGMTHMTINWEAMGHPPVTFLVPHFDFHFYLIPEADRLAIDCGDLTKATAVPDGYALVDETLPPELVAITGVETLVGVCVPEMGMHALSTAEAANTEPFDGTIIVGYYGDAPIFIEPMISQAFLLERQSFDLPIPAIPGLEGSQPTTFRAEYLADSDAFRFSFGGFGGADQ
ncbi:MAG: hypothetical protein R3195_06400 [Gemmatimonadota bacterium]|nr:hypothetical protein [Gemmatimonadota bacterium]